MFSKRCWQLEDELTFGQSSRLGGSVAVRFCDSVMVVLQECHCIAFWLVVQGSSRYVSSLVALAFLVALLVTVLVVMLAVAVAAGFLKLGFPFGGFHNKDCSILGSILGSPFFGNYHISVWTRARCAWASLTKHPVHAT